MLLEIENLSIDFETSKGMLQAVRQISFQLEAGETLGIVGESGCGKSVTNLALMNLLPNNALLQASKMHFSGKDLLSLPEREWQNLRGGDMAMIFQDPMTALNPSYNVGFQIEETLKAHHPHMTKEERRERIFKLLGQVGIPAASERMHAYPHELSGGMGQRIMIAMALAGTPKLLIADEPTTALDVTIQDQILKLLKDIQAENQMGLIFITHDLEIVAHIADTIQVMYSGEIVERGTPQQIIHSPQHPYSEGLLNSLPGYKDVAFRQKLSSIPGLVPRLNQRPSGCQFAPRCSHAQAECHKAPPALMNFNGRLVRCPFPSDQRKSETKKERP